MAITLQRATAEGLSFSSVDIHTRVSEWTIGQTLWLNKSASEHNLRGLQTRCTRVDALWYSEYINIIGSYIGLSPGRHKAIIRINAGILLILPPGANFNWISIEVHAFQFTKMHMKMSVLPRPQCDECDKVWNVTLLRASWLRLPGTLLTGKWLELIYLFIDWLIDQSVDPWSKWVNCDLRKKERKKEWGKSEGVGEWVSERVSECVSE